MAIIVAGTIQLAPGEGERARDLLAGHMAAVRAEEGCELYSFAYDVEDPDLIRVSERWTSAEALAAHGAAPHQKAFVRALQAHAPGALSIKAWDGTFWRTLIGD
jgi:quinol monooxygenase YgiN